MAPAPGPEGELNADRNVSRRSFLLTAGAAVVVPSLDGASPAIARIPASPALDILRAPDAASVELEPLEIVALGRTGNEWTARDVNVNIAPTARMTTITLRSPIADVRRVRLRWRMSVGPQLLYLGDHVERSYGDLEWRHLAPDRVMPWYFVTSDGDHACGYGVRTGARAIALWQVDSAGVSLWLDVRNGGTGVRLGSRVLDVASIVAIEGERGESAFDVARRLCRVMCEAPRLTQRVFGVNNWYYAYGVSSADEILRDTERCASWAPAGGGGGVRPFSVIDDGWQIAATSSATDCCSGGPWRYGNARFPDMPGLARRIRDMGVRPGIWLRPVRTQERVSESWLLSRERFGGPVGAFGTLDPTVPEVLSRIEADVRGLVEWGYELVKHDFTTNDLLGRWGFRMGATITDDGWHFADRSKTTAEVVVDLYRAIRAGAGEAVVLGCNTIGHLAAGLVDVQRIGDDTSGKDWDRTRRMGVNGLAFRLCQDGAFFAVDADCVGITKAVPWEMNAKWLDLLARSGTLLFVSAAPDAVGVRETSALKEAFRLAAERHEAEPLDWLETTIPARWRLDGREVRYDWFGAEGVNPFGS
jgi:alpha-galactosidase